MFWGQESEENPLNPFTHLRYGYTIIADYMSVLWLIIQEHFWHGFFGFIIFYYIYYWLLKDSIIWMRQKYARYQERKWNEKYDAEYHKNPDLFSERISAQQSYAQKLQEKYKIEVERYQELIKQKETEKRQELLARTAGDISIGHSVGNSTNSDRKSKSLKPEYNPLMGPGGSSYRPAKKSKCPGGGCGG